MTTNQIEIVRTRLTDNAAPLWEIALQLSILNQRNAEYFAMAKEALNPRPLVTVHPRRALRRRKVDAEFKSKRGAAKTKKRNTSRFQNSGLRERSED
jgi:hypothetical protein